MKLVREMGEYEQDRGVGITGICIIPCYNESKRLSPVSFIEFIKTNPHIRFLFVNDGSSDDTLTILTKITAECSRFHLLNLGKNYGKAEAVRLGMIHAYENFESDFIGFWDADLATPLYEIPSFIDQAVENNFDIVTGLRLMRLGAEVKRNRKRHYLGRIFATVVSTMIDLPVYDTQCGAKLFKRSVIPVLFNDVFITKWFFDVEILARYIQYLGKDNAINKIYEYPLFKWVDIGGSKLKIKDFITAPFELRKIKRKYLT
ncbi:MAG: glycosyltransferase family 2 protein [Bacteroidales bacterium]|jgi:glycosyltransferase involved in cell wall biosynthesis|nr:glycosyltransferase family 2 protein [Bacteroidales bacterium]